MVKPIREFSANEGDYSIGLSGPDAIEHDIDNLARMFDPLTTHTDGSKGGISSENIQDGVVADNNIGDRTIDDSISDAYTNTGTLTKLFSMIAKAIKSLKGTATWSGTTSDTMEGMHVRIGTNTSNIANNQSNLETHRTSVDHDTRYYTKTLLDGGQLDNRYFTETELANGVLDTRYYTESEINTKLTNLEGTVMNEYNTVLVPDYNTKMQMASDTIDGYVSDLEAYKVSTSSELETELQDRLSMVKSVSRWERDDVFTAPANGITEFTIPIPEYNIDNDLITLWYQGLTMTKDVHYTLSTVYDVDEVTVIGAKVTLGFTLSSGETIHYRVSIAVGLDTINVEASPGEGAVGFIHLDTELANAVNNAPSHASETTTAHGGIVPDTRTINGKPLSTDITLNMGDINPDGSTFVPETRTVNGKALSTDIALDYSDVSAVPNTRTVNGKALSTDISLVASDVGSVPTTRTVNGKALSTNISLNSSDIGLSTDQTRKITTSTSAPSGGSDGDIWFRYI